MANNSWINFLCETYRFFMRSPWSNFKRIVEYYQERIVGGIPQGIFWKHTWNHRRYFLKVSRRKFGRIRGDTAEGTFDGINEKHVESFLGRVPERNFEFLPGISVRIKKNPTFFMNSKLPVKQFLMETLKGLLKASLKPHQN